MQSLMPLITAYVIQVSEVAEKLAQAVEPFGCQLVEGVLTHDLKQFVIDGNKVSRRVTQVVGNKGSNWVTQMAKTRVVIG